MMSYDGLVYYLIFR